MIYWSVIRNFQLASPETYRYYLFKGSNRTCWSWVAEQGISGVRMLIPNSCISKLYFTVMQLPEESTVTAVGVLDLVQAFGGAPGTRSRTSSPISCLLHGRGVSFHRPPKRTTAGTHARNGSILAWLLRCGHELAVQWHSPWHGRTRSEPEPAGRFVGVQAEVHSILFWVFQALWYTS